MTCKDSPPTPNKNNLDVDDCGFTKLPDPEDANPGLEQGPSVSSND